MNRHSHYTVLALLMTFYLVAQIFQQFVLRVGPLASVEGLEETIIAGQHPLNYMRMILILLSMFFMVPGFIILGLHFYRNSPLLSIVSIAFFLFFCLFETSYRSVQLFQVMMIWGKEYAQAGAEARAVLLPQFQTFYDTVNAIYFPLLFSMFLGSLCLFFASLKDATGKLITIAMGISAIQQLSRLSGYTPFDALNIFTGIWYFVLVALVFGLSIFWAIRMASKSNPKGV